MMTKLWHLPIAGIPLALPALLLATPSTTLAQDGDLVDQLRDVLRSEAKRVDQGNAFQSLMIFGSMPGISTAHFSVDDDGSDDFTINPFKLPLSHDFDPVWGTVRPYAELTLGYLTAKEKQHLNLVPPESTTVKADFTSYSALAGAGVSIPVSEHTVLRPIFLLGYAHVSDDAKVRGPYSDELSEAASDFLFDVDIDSYQVGAALQVEYQRPLANDINLAANARYNYLYSDVYNASDSVLETNDDFGVFTARAEFDGPTGQTVFGRDLRWIGFLAGTYLPGSQSDALGFDSFVEIGGGLEFVDPNVIQGIEGVSLRASGIVGDNVSGWSVGVELEF